MSFGFSIGDIFATVGLGFRVCKTIRDSPVEHIDLALQLEAFRKSLEDWKHDVAGLGLPSPTAESTGEQLSRCSELFQRLNETTARYMENDLSRKDLYKRRKNLRKEFEWAVYRRDEIVRLRDDLKSQMDTFLQIYNKMMVQENKVILERIIKGTPVSLDEWHHIKPILFIDALDRQRKFPAELCETWEGLQDLLKLNFKESYGRSWVDAGRYQITDETAGTILTAKDWNNRIKPGMMVSMAMLLQKRGVSNTTEHNCPTCDSPYGGAKGEVLERVQCKKCATWFQISSQPRIEELGDDYDGPDELDVTAEDKQLMQLVKADASFDIGEARFFRRLHVLLEKAEPEIRSTSRTKVEL